MSSPRQVLRPLILVSSVFGPLPYTPSLKFSTLLLISCVFVNSVPPAYILNSAIENLKTIHYLPAYVSLQAVPKISCFIACMANLYFLYRRRAKFFLILSRFEEIHKIFKFCDAELDKPRRQVQLIIFTICVLARAIDLLDIAINPQNYSLSNLSYLVNYIIAATALQSLGTQFLSFSVLVLLYLKHINRKIAEMKQLYFAGTKQKIISKQIEDLRAAHNKLCENAYLVNRVYGIYLLLPLSYISIHLQMDVFQIIRYILDYLTEFPHDLLGGTEWLIAIMWIMNDINKLSIFFVISYLVRVEVTFDIFETSYY
jgi:hypothetical protein